MITKILLVLAAALVVFLVVAAFQSDDCQVERSTIVAAPPAAAFAYVNDFRKWQEVSPYVKLDPAAKYTFGGAAAGPGASLAWSGNSQIGEGSLTITESRPAELVRMRLLYARPFKCDNVVEFSFRPAADGRTTVTWSMSGKTNFVAKAMSLVIDMDKMVGKEFENGLATIKTRAEADARARENISSI